MQQRISSKSSTDEDETEGPDAGPAICDMMPLTQSKMHAAAAPVETAPLLPRRSALLIEILSFALIAFLVVSALLFNFTAPGRLIGTTSGVTVQLPPKPAEPVAEVATPVVEVQPAAEAVASGIISLPDVQPQAGVPAPAETPVQVEPPQTDALVETASLPPAAEPVSPEPRTQSADEPTGAPAEDAASPPLPAAEAEALIRRGDELLGTGDIAAARSAYERAAAGGNRLAALGVAKTYDPIFLAQTGVRGLRGDPARAALWYGKAAAAGDRDAQQRLRRLRAQYPQ